MEGWRNITSGWSYIKGMDANIFLMRTRFLTYLFCVFYFTSMAALPLLHVTGIILPHPVPIPRSIDTGKGHFSCNCCSKNKEEKPKDNSNGKSKCPICSAVAVLKHSSQPPEPVSLLVLSYVEHTLCTHDSICDLESPIFNPARAPPYTA